MFDVMTVSEAAEKWGISVRMVQTLCQRGKIEGAAKFNKSWMIPANAEKPADGRIKSGKYINWKKKKGTGGAE